MRGAVPLWLGLAVGIAAGLAYGWVIQPVRLTDTIPGALRPDFQDDYVSLIAVAHAATGDLPRARARLALIPGALDPDRLAALAQSRLAAERPAAEVQALAGLAAMLEDRSATPSVVATPTVVRGPTSTPAAPAATARPLPSPQPTFTPGAPFRLTERRLVCDDPAPQPRLQVVVLDAAGDGVPYVPVRVLWDDGQDQFFTGFKPELGLGFGDFTLDPQVEYTVQLGESDTIASGLRSEPCPEPSGATHPGSWRLTFVQPSTP